jgi:hypothetical protein
MFRWLVQRSSWTHPNVEWRKSEDWPSLRVVAYERRYFVAVLLQLGEYMRSKKTGRSCECYLHGSKSPSLHVNSVK